MTAFKDMTPMQRIAAMRKTGVNLFPNLFPNLSKEKKSILLYIEDEPAVSAQRDECKLADLLIG